MTWWVFANKSDVGAARTLAKGTDTLVGGAVSPIQYTKRWATCYSLSDGTFAFQVKPGMAAPSGASVVADISSLTPVAYTSYEAEDVVFGPTNKTSYFGINISGAEFGAVPGTQNSDYTLPTLDSIGYYFEKGMRLVRMPFLWERMQPGGLGTALNTTHVNWLTTILGANPSLKVILDVHNFGTYWDGTAYRTIGVDTHPSNAEFAAFWTLLANQFKSFPNAIFGLMNEPHIQTAAQWQTTAAAAIAAIRATGATNLILAQGTSFTGAWTWVTSGNAAAWAGFSDPNLAFEMHQYFDSDGSGQNATAVSSTIGSERLAAATAWCRTNGYKAFLGEMGAANNPTMLACLSDCVNYMNTNSDVWLGWSIWSGGPWWGTYFQSVEPTNWGQYNQTDSGQMATLLPYL